MDKEKFLLEAEKRFKKAAKLTQDISNYPLSKDIDNIETDKAKSKQFSEVFTPLWLVDEMIGQAKFKGADTSTLDLCAGYGQFSVRLMRYFYEKYPSWDTEKFKSNHAFSELQLSSCYKLLITFGNKITLFIGDSTHLNKLPPTARGVWCYIENYGYWVCLTKTISRILSPNGIKKKACSEAEFVSSIETLVKNLNKAYSIASDIVAKQPTKQPTTTLEQLMSCSNTRAELLKEINSLTKDDKGQMVVRLIPSDLVSDMLDRVDDLEKKSILVLYNCEIVDQLITKKKLDPSKITFADDLKGALKSDMMKKLYGVETINFSDIAALHSSFKGRKFDVCFSNPPYNRGLDLKILLALIDKGTVETSVAKEFVWVHPSTWLLDRKGKNILYGKVKTAINNKLKDVKFFNGYSVFGCEGLDICSVNHIDINYNSNKTNIILFEETFTVDNLEDITKFGKAWSSIVKPFVVRISKAIRVGGHIWSHNVRFIDSEKEHCQLAAIIGHTSKDGSTKVKDDFYTLTMKNISDNKGIRQPNLNRPGNPTPTFEFTTANERDNFLLYLNTDFARFCLAILKNGKNAAVGEMELIPWLDFTQPWDDEKLFQHFDINKETQDYIREFLPDYYGIRK